MNIYVYILHIMLSDRMFWKFLFDEWPLTSLFLLTMMLLKTVTDTHLFTVLLFIQFQVKQIAFTLITLWKYSFIVMRITIIELIVNVTDVLE